MPPLRARSCLFLPADALRLLQLREARGRGAFTDARRIKPTIISQNDDPSLPGLAGDHSSSFIHKFCPEMPFLSVRTGTRTDGQGIARAPPITCRNRRRTRFAACCIRIGRVRRRRRLPSSAGRSVRAAGPRRQAAAVEHLPHHGTNRGTAALIRGIMRVLARHVALAPLPARGLHPRLVRLLLSTLLARVLVADDSELRTTLVLRNNRRGPNDTSAADLPIVPLFPSQLSGPLLLAQDPPLRTGLRGNGISTRFSLPTRLRRRAARHGRHGYDEHPASQRRREDCFPRAHERPHLMNARTKTPQSPLASAKRGVNLSPGTRWWVTCAQCNV